MLAFMTKPTGKPRGRPATGIKYPVPLQVYMSNEMHMELQGYALLQGKSASAVIRELIGKAINDRQAESEG